MTDQTKKTTLLEQIARETKEAKRKQVKGKVKVLIDDLMKAEATREGIIDQITEELRTIGEDASTLNSILED